MCGDHDFSSREGGNETRAEEAPKMTNSNGWGRGQSSFFIPSAQVVASLLVLQEYTHR
jgi:hypothetical protein